MELKYGNLSSIVPEDEELIQQIHEECKHNPDVKSLQNAIANDILFRYWAKQLTSSEQLIEFLKKLNPFQNMEILSPQGTPCYLSIKNGKFYLTQGEHLTIGQTLDMLENMKRAEGFIYMDEFGREYDVKPDKVMLSENELLFSFEAMCPIVILLVGEDRGKLDLIADYIFRSYGTSPIPMCTTKTQKFTDLFNGQYRFVDEEDYQYYKDHLAVYEEIDGEHYFVSWTDIQNYRNAVILTTPEGAEYFKEHSNLDDACSIYQIFYLDSTKNKEEDWHVTHLNAADSAEKLCGKIHKVLVKNQIIH